MAHFDADAYRAAREPFTVTVDGRRCVARPVSAELVIQLQPQLASSSAHEANEALRRLLRAAFPARIAHLWVGDPVRHIMRLDPVSRRQLVTDFFRYLGGSNPLPPATNGTPSPKPT